jgi:hypothetical protein
VVSALSACAEIAALELTNFPCENARPVLYFSAMKKSIALVLVSLITSAAFAGDYTRTIFADDFSSGSFGPRWGHYKSSSVVKDGVLVGITSETSDHNAVDNVKFEGERDLEVSVKFRFVSDKAKSFNVWFDDKDYKGSHAGHICSVSVSPTSVNIGDAKTGNFRNDIYEKKKATPSTLTAEDKAMLATKNKSLPVNLTLKDWHTLVIQTNGEEVSVSIDGKAVGSFKSEGVGHDHKTLVSLTTNQVDVHYDDFSIKAAAKR